MQAQSSQTKNQSARITFLDALRGIAILLVFTCHAAAICHLGGVQGWLATKGTYGVQLFFVISACTIFLTFERSLKRERHPTRNFFIRRLFRIVPVYWAGILLYSSVFGFETRGWFPGPEGWHIPLHVLLINSLHPAVQSSVVPGGWSISCEVLFYATVPLWFRLIKTRAAALWGTGISMVVGPLLVILLSRIFSSSLSAWDGELNYMFWERIILNQLGCFGCGIVLFFSLQERVRPSVARLWAWFLLCLGAGLTCAYLQSAWPKSIHLLSISFVFLGLALADSPTTWLVNRFTLFFGRISFSGYLVHFLVLALLARWLPIPFGSRTFQFALLMAVGLPITACLAYVSYRLIERPFMILGHRLATETEAPARN